MILEMAERKCCSRNLGPTPLVDSEMPAGAVQGASALLCQGANTVPARGRLNLKSASATTSSFRISRVCNAVVGAENFKMYRWSSIKFVKLSLKTRKTEVYN